MFVYANIMFDKRILLRMQFYCQKMTKQQVSQKVRKGIKYLDHFSGLGYFECFLDKHGKR